MLATKSISGRAASGRPCNRQHVVQASRLQTPASTAIWVVLDIQEKRVRMCMRPVLAAWHLANQAAQRAVSNSAKRLITRNLASKKGLAWP